MPIPVLPQSQVNGEIFVSNFYAFHDLLQVPSVMVDASHPFRQLWHSHLQSLTQTGGLFEGVIDCLAAILLGDPLWKETTPTAVSQTRSDVHSLLIRTPPNVVIISDLRDYACHVRCPALWNFICISKGYVDLWMEADKPAQKHGLTALLVTSIDHEMGHWAQSIKNRLYCLPVPSSSSNFTDLTDDPDHPSNGNKVTSRHDETTSRYEEALMYTQKAFQAPWMSESAGEAGEFLEFSTRGGIMEYDLLYKRVYLVVSEGASSFPTDAYLELYERNEGPPKSLFFHSDSPKTSSLSDIKMKDAYARFPFEGVDGCQSPRRSCHQRNYHHTPTKVLKL